MDIYSTASTAIRDIYAITVYIRTVIKDVENRSQDQIDIQDELDHDFGFLETFHAVVFNDSSQWFESLPESLQRDVNYNLTRLRRCLDAYENVALKHGLNLSEAYSSLERQAEQIDPNGLGTSSKEASRAKAGSLRSRLEEKMKKLRLEKKLNEITWALFDKEEVLKLVGQYGKWTRELRQTLILIILASAKLGNVTRADLGGKDGAGISNSLGVTKEVRRQIRANLEHPKDFPPLEGDFVPDHDGDTIAASPYTTGIFTDRDSGEFPVIMERHTFAIIGDDKSERQKQEMKLELVRRLAWLFMNSGMTPICLLGCLGFYATRKTKLFLTLHDWINPIESKAHQLTQRERKEKWKVLQEKYKILEERNKLEAERNKSKPELSSRFFLAWALASTIYNIHASGWVHKNIWSRGVLIFPTSNISSLDQRNIPYLPGWSVSRPQTEESRNVSKFQQEGAEEDDPDENLKIEDQPEGTTNSDSEYDEHFEQTTLPGYDLEHELYRHPERYQGGTTTYENKHDLYSLGVLLLEIGLWSTISIDMSTAISRARESPSRPPDNIMEKIKERLWTTSKDRRLAAQMGSEYVEIVQRCLMGRFEHLKGNSGANVERDDRGNAELTREFHRLVVEPLRVRASLF
ncbi:hypothetical protein BJ875DRAFT_528878 [Amylocarpus encephaloides]|uniref:Protein kinase domain-containing protein n=1 Tax=Amylocarpus encephaloides TaxID=45428 RepID=A0A9P7Y701_9HELO|nr:hypothetical protein BJ875DRAFT_528878 [Amylocarpus encephaloides]